MLRACGKEMMCIVEYIHRVKHLFCLGGKCGNREENIHMKTGRGDGNWVEKDENREE